MSNTPPIFQSFAFRVAAGALIVTGLLLGGVASAPHSLNIVTPTVTSTPAPTTPYELEWWPDPTFPPAVPPQHARPTAGAIGTAESITNGAGQ